MDEKLEKCDTLVGDAGESKTTNLKIQSRLGRYLVIEKLGRGGMGVVYKAYDPELDRRIALKVLGTKRSDAEQSQRAHARLLREAQAMAQLSHPNVVSVYDVGSVADAIFIAMEFVDGQTLREWQKQPDLTVKQKLDVFVAAGRGLAAAHQADLVHRDFKPENVMLGQDGRARVLDFGLARAAVENPQSIPHLDEELSSLDSEHSSESLLSSQLTRQGALVGTPAYMSPEQMLGSVVGEKSDQFSFCVAMYEALYGKRPFRGKRIKQVLAEVLMNKLEKPQPEKQEGVPVIPAWLYDILAKGLRVDPAERHSDMDELLDALCDDPEIARVQRRQRIRRATWTTLSIVMAALIPLTLLLLKSYQTDQLCKKAPFELAEVWSDKSRKQMKKAFAALSQSYALDTYNRVRQNLDQFGQAWVEMHTQTCLATHVDRIQSDSLLDLRMTCLHAKLDKMAALVRVLSSSLGKKVLDNAVQASLSLAGLEHCTDAQALRAAFPPPPPKSRTQVESLQAQLDRLEALESAGIYQLGLEKAARIAQQCAQTNYKPIVARSLLLLGSLQESNGEHKQAADTFDRAIQATAEAKDYINHAKAWSNLIWVEGVRNDQFEKAMALKRAAYVSLTLVGQDSVLRGKLMLTLAGVLDFHGHSQAARRHYHQALSILIQTQGEQHPDVALIYNSLAVMHYHQEEYARAQDLYQKALAIWERVFGVGHPYVSYSFNNLALVHLEQHQFDKAQPLFEKADAIWEIAGGSEHPLLSWTQQGLGWIALHQGNIEQARTHFARAVSICEAKGCEGFDRRPFSRALFGLARTLSHGSNNISRSQKLAQRALKLSQKFTSPLSKKHNQQISHWLRRFDASPPPDRR